MNQRILEKVLLVGLIDYIGLWEVVRMARDAHPVRADRDLRNEILEVVDHLLSEDLAIPGEPTPDGTFAEWALGSSEALEKIATDWVDLGRAPNVGEIVWLALTPKGEEAARRARASNQS